MVVIYFCIAVIANRGLCNELSMCFLVRGHLDKQDIES